MNRCKRMARKHKNKSYYLKQVFGGYSNSWLWSGVKLKPCCEMDYILVDMAKNTAVTVECQGLGLYKCGAE